MIYLDYAATTPVHKEVYEVMAEFFTMQYGNPNSKYYDLAEYAKKSVENARGLFAKYFGVSSGECIFTSGATESNNMIIKGVAFKYDKPQHMITTKIEHSSVIETMNYLERIGWEITYLNPDKNGFISPEELSGEIKHNTTLISIGWVNSEIGTIQNIETLSEIANDKNIFFHTDATQAIGKIDVKSYDISNINFISFSSHKIYGPKGIGIAIIKKDVDGVPNKIVPLIHGGEQEFGMRGGTLNVAGIIGFAKAFELIIESIKPLTKHYKALDGYFIKLLKQHFDKSTVLINNFEQRVPGILSVQFKGINNQILLKKTKNIFAASTGSACSNSKPSYVLLSIGVSEKATRETVRFSLGQNTNKKDLDILFEQLN